ncbi:MAG: HTH-type transcriptional activator IlvY [Pseudomonadota bacterium]
MNPRNLRLFLHLCRTLHFGRAARDAHVSASSLSRVISRLEQECGATLFERDNRTVRVTPAGMQYREFAEDVLGRWSTLQESLHQQSVHLQGRLSLFCSVTASYSVLPQLLDAFRGAHPAIELRLHTGDSELALQRVLDESDDLAVAAMPDRLPDTLSFLPVAESDLVLIAPRIDCPVRRQLDEAAARKREPDWSAMPFVSSESGLMRSRTEVWFRQWGSQPNVYARVSGNEAIVSMVGLGFGIGMVPRLVVENSPMVRSVEVIDVQPEAEPFAIGLCCLRRRRSNPLVRALWELAEKPVPRTITQG